MEGRFLWQEKKTQILSAIQNIDLKEEIVELDKEDCWERTMHHKEFQEKVHLRNGSNGGGPQSCRTVSNETRQYFEVG